ncbi:MAG: elongation factor P, partial [Rhodospirillales bacterium]
TQPGKGGAYLQVELKELRDGTKLNERFRSSEKVERVSLEQNLYQFLFEDGGLYTFMDNLTYEQIQIGASVIREEQIPYLQ